MRDAAGQLADRLELLRLAELFFACIQSFLDSLTLDELADLAANSDHHSQQIRIRLANRVTKELHHAQDFRAKPYRESASAMEAYPCRDSGPRKVRVLNYVGNPYRLAVAPDSSGKADPRR